MFDAGLGNTKVTPRLIEIMRVVARNNAITADDLKSESRQRSFAWPRQIAAYLCREMTTCSLPEIGRMFGGRDHTTILFAFRKVGSLLDAGHPLLTETLEQYRAEIITDALARIEAEGLTRIAPAPPPRGYTQVIRHKYKRPLSDIEEANASLAGVQ